MYSKINTQTPLSGLVTLAEAKAQCRVTHTFDDDLIESLIPAAAEKAQRYTRRLLSPANVTSVIDENQRMSVQLPYGEVTSVNEVLLDGEDYTDFEFDDITQKVTVDKSYSKMRVTYDCGYTVLPDAVKHAILICISTLYNNREDFIAGVTVAELPQTSMTLLDTVRYYGV